MKKTYYPGIMWITCIILLIICTIGAFAPITPDMTAKSAAGSEFMRYFLWPFVIVVTVVVIRWKICFCVDRIIIRDASLMAEKRKYLKSTIIFIIDIKSIVVEGKEVFIEINDGLIYWLSLDIYNQKEEIIDRFQRISKEINECNHGDGSLIDN